MEKHIIVGVHITERVKHAGDVQKVLTDFGCQIRTRLGLHEADQNLCSPNGMILLERSARLTGWTFNRWFLIIRSFQWLKRFFPIPGTS
jgi:hypothetical protein